MKSLRGNGVQGPKSEEGCKRQSQSSRQVKCPTQKKLSFEKTAMKLVSVTLKDIFNGEGHPESTDFRPRSNLGVQQKIPKGDKYPISREHSKDSPEFIQQPKLLPQKKPCKGNQSGLIVHGSLHGREKPFGCRECGRTFSPSTHLIEHQRTHTGERPYECSECGRAFSRSTNLNQHQRTHTQVKPYECRACGKAFSDRSTMIQHQRIHTGENPYKCSRGGKSFSWVSSLSEHQRTRTGENPYECSDCGKVFSRARLLSDTRASHRGALLSLYQAPQEHLHVLLPERLGSHTWTTSHPSFKLSSTPFSSSFLLLLPLSHSPRNAQMSDQ
ncbi:zinc finger protein 391-like [Marmota monax]|uniref:zinc finger protein 391-like n=1 Tax=Marmota monax TaxID=9995 RepID=UPI001EB0757E|nr:zinc finger protein 391-like [Marmota monax]